MAKAPAKWFLDKRSGNLRCKKCGLRAADRSRGHSHSFCWVEPSPGVGHPRARDLPIKISEGFSSVLNERMVRYLDRDRSAESRALRALRERYPHYAAVVYAHQVEGETLRSIATKLGLTVENAKKRNQRGERFYRQRLALYQGEEDRAA